MKYSYYILLLALFLNQCKPEEDKTITQFAGKPKVPSSIKKEHEYLLCEVGKIAMLKDSTGKAGVRLNELLQHHFKEEEDYVLPPLGYLPILSQGKIPPQSKEVIGLTEKLKMQLDHMSAEHQLIKEFMAEMVRAAAKENHPEVAALEKELSKHAATEEEVFFPVAILIGEYLKIKGNDN